MLHKNKPLFWKKFYKGWLILSLKLRLLICYNVSCVTEPSAVSPLTDSFAAKLLRQAKKFLFSDNESVKKGKMCDEAEGC